METQKNYKISVFGEFIDKSMESEFLVNSTINSSKNAAYIALIFASLFLLFLFNDIFIIKRTFSFLIITIIRLAFVIISMIVFFVAKLTTNFRSLIILVTLYQALIVTLFISILEQYDSLSYLSILGLMVVSFAIYLLPNKIMISQLISVILSILFFLYPSQKIEGLKENDIYKIIVYQVVLLIYCNMQTCLTESYKRKQFSLSREYLVLSTMDHLTGINNRGKFDNEINTWINFSNRYSNPLSLILFDIDNFKRINDCYGHLVGDNVIKTIVATIKGSIRITDSFARWGGDEFVILLPDTNIQQAEDMAERMITSIRNNSYGQAKDITCSFGVTTLGKDDTAQTLLRKADDLLLQAKACGKDRVISKPSKS